MKGVKLLGRFSLSAIALGAALLVLPATTLAADPTLYTQNLYAASGVRYQNPDKTACAATSTQMMLNFISMSSTGGTGGTDLSWSATTSYAAQEEIVSFSRSHNTMLASSSGTDPNGWRNALNYFGYGDFENAATMTYKVQAYSSYAGAVKSAVMAIARFGKPVGILGWAGKHAQIINGYQVSGQDPATSSNFTVLAIYLTDPLAKDGLRNVRISNANFANGSLTYRFRRYAETDSPYVDPYTPGATVARNGWYGKWVILAPVR